VYHKVFVIGPTLSLVRCMNFLQRRRMKKSPSPLFCSWPAEASEMLHSGVETVVKLSCTYYYLLHVHCMHVGSVSGDVNSPLSSHSTTVNSASSVVSPCLVSAVSSLLSNLINLAPEESLVCIQNENIVSSLLRYVTVVYKSCCSLYCYSFLYISSKVHFCCISFTLSKIVIFK